MPNEFVARNGIIALNNSIITGSLTVTGGITGSFQGTASFATTSSNVLGGAANYIPLWNGATTLSSSVLYQSSGNIGIGTTSPSQKLDIAGYAIAGVTDRALIGQDGTYSGYSTVGFGGVGNGSNRVFGSSTTADGLYLAAATGRGIRFRVNGTDTDNMIINSSGNVGIGTTSPAAKLHIKQLSSEIPLILDNSNGTSGSFTQYRVNASTGWEVGMAGSGDSYKWFFSYGTFSSTNSKFTITNTGDIGVGTIAPQYKLHVVGGHVKLPNNYKLYFGDVAENLGFQIGSDGASNNMVISQANNATLQISTAGSSGHIRFTPNSSESVRFTGGGNVGIGTTTPEQKLVVSNAGAEGLEFIPAPSANSNQIQSYNRSTSAYNSLVLRALEYNVQVGTTPALYVSASGNVGIGTTTPTEKLTVRGNGAKLLIEAQSDPTGYYTYLQTNYDAANPFNLVSQGFPILGAISGISPTTSRTTYVSSYYDLSLHAGANPGPTGSNSALFISSSRNIGIGTTTPGARLDVYTTGDPTAFFRAAGDFSVNFRGSTLGNTQLFSIRNNNTSVVHLNTQNSARLALGVSAATGSGTVVEHVTINSSGNVGIGTTSPSQKLEVSGNISVTGVSGGNRYIIVGDATNTYTGTLVLQAGGGSSTWGGGVVMYGHSHATYPGSVYIGGSEGSSGPIIFGRGGIGPITELMRITSAGNVGIGTTSPNAKLDVNGNAIVSGSFTVVTGSAVELQVTNTGVRIGNAITDNHPVTGSLNVTGSATLVGTFTQTPFKSIIIRSLSASATQAREFEILRGITDFNDWSETGVVEIEVHEQQWGRGLKKTYSFSYGYFDAAEFKLIEMIGSPSSNNFQLRMGSKTLISGEVYYYPVYAQVRYYGIVDIIVKTRRNITTNPVSTTNGDLYVNTAPTASNISDFTADTTVTLNNAASAIDVTGSFAVSNTVTTQNLAVNGTNATFNSTNTTINSTNIIVGNDAADLVGIAANTMYFPGNGRVAIGTTTPQRLLDVYNQSTSGIVASFGAQISNTNFSGISFGYVEAANTSYRKSALVFERSETHGGGSNASGKIHFLLNNNGASSATALTDAVVTIDSVGTTVGSARVGIGTRFPTASLHISGSVSTDNLVRVQSSTGTEYFFISASGNIGLGTASPTSLLTVGGSTGATATPTAIELDRTYRTGGDAFDKLKFYLYRDATQTYGIGLGDVSDVQYWAGSSSTGVHKFFTSQTERLRIIANGNVGIGTTSPSTKLHVVGQTYITDDLLIRGTHNPYASSNRGVIALNGTGGNIISFASATTTHGYMFVTSTQYEFVTVANQNFIFYNGGTEALRITNAGNVGIGTTSPSVRLQVHGNTLITGSLTVGQSTTGSSEHTLTVGVPPAAGAGEGGQILLAASGGLYTSASMIDNYQNKFRVLRGTNAGSDGYKLQIDMHTGQVQIPNYNSSTAFTGTAVADLAVDSNGNIITVTPGGGGGGSVTINNNTDNYLITATGTANTLNGEANLQFNGSTLTVTGGLTVITGSATELQVTNTGVNIGNALTDAHRVSGSISMPHTASGLIRLQDASVWANSANYLYPQIRLPDYQTGITLVNNDEVQFVTNGTAAMAAKLEAGIPNIRFDNATVLKWSTAATNGFNYDVLLRRESAAVLALTGSLKVNGSVSSNVAFNRVTASYTFALSDAGKTVEVSASAAGTYNLTVPPASTTNFPDGASIDVILYGTGSIQFVTGSGVTFRSANSWTKLSTRYGAATLINIAGDEWYLIGNLNP